MVDYLKSKWQILAAAGGLLLVVLALVFAFGGNQPANNPPTPSQTPSQTPASTEPAPADQTGDDDANQATDEPASGPQIASVRIRQLELELTLLAVDCQPLNELADQLAADRTPSQIQAAFEKYEQGLSTLPSDEVWELYEISGALDYMLNLKNYLSQAQTDSPLDSASVYRSLSLYQQCAVSLSAENQGADSAFGNGCELSLDDHASASDNQGQQHQPLYLGPAIACTEAQVPFVFGDTTPTAIIFSLPLEAELSSVTIQNDHPEADPVVFDLSPTET